MKYPVSVVVLLALVPSIIAGDVGNVRPVETDILSKSSLWEVINEKIGNPAKEAAAAPHIMGGEEASPNQFPHQVLIRPVGGAACGASLISAEWMLTAGHCVQNVKEINAVLGGHDHPNNGESTRQIIPVAEVISHNYIPQEMRNDIALMKLQRPATLNEFVKPIRLPALSEQKMDFTGQPVTLSGWGRMTDEPPAWPMKLRFVSSKAISVGSCTSFWGGFGDDTRICIEGKGGVGICSGDSGGPLTWTESDGQLTLVGVASYSGHPCGGGAPSGFTRVDRYLYWISEKTGIPLRK